MFVGHLGVGLALSSRSRRFRLGPLLGATMLLDVLLGVFVLARMEQVIVPPDFATGHYLEFVFPYSHGLLNSLLWASLTAGLAGAGWLLLGRGARRRLDRRGRGPLALPLRRGGARPGPPPPRRGLSPRRPRAVAGDALGARARGAPARGRGGAVPPLARRRCPGSGAAVLLAVLGLLALIQVVGQLGGALPPPASVLAVSWIVQTGVLVVLGLWADPAPVSAPAVAASAG